jgi:hypothetical protein
MAYDDLTAFQLQLLNDIRTTISSGNYESEFQANFPQGIQGGIALIPISSNHALKHIECGEGDFQALVSHGFILSTTTSRDSYRGRLI